MCRTPSLLCRYRLPAANREAQIHTLRVAAGLISISGTGALGADAPAMKANSFLAIFRRPTHFVESGVVKVDRRISVAHLIDWTDDR
jgi:hypothetical protein